MTHVTGAQRFLRGVRRIEAAGRPASIAGQGSGEGLMRLESALGSENRLQIWC
jgi:hypothetical protein